MPASKKFEDRIKQLPLNSGKKILVTGCAGFIGSHVLEALLYLDCQIIGLDNFSTGSQRNLDLIRDLFPSRYESNFQFVEGDICNAVLCEELIDQADYIIHLAALGSVPRSIQDPRSSLETNIMGFFNILDAARKQQGKRLVFASSSSIFGNDPNLPKEDGKYGNVLSPYAASKRADELISESFANCYSTEVIGLRFFNVFGERQNPNGPYAAVIPRWATALLNDTSDCVIFGDGKTSRDFTYVKNVIYGILLALTTRNAEAFGKTLNLACGDATSLNDLFSLLKNSLGKYHSSVVEKKARYEEFRLGDIRHSTADISLITNLLGYSPLFSIPEGLDLSAPEFVKQYG